MFDVVFELKGREVHRAALPFLPTKDAHVIVNEKTYIVMKIEYDLSAYQEQGNPVIPVRVVVLRKTDNDF